MNARLLEQAGYVQKLMAGVYTFLPLGTRVLHKIEQIVREEMDTVGVEMLMPSLQPKENWVATGRWESLDVLFKLKSQQDSDYALGPTHEEVVTPAGKRCIGSYRDLPLAVYQIQTKFRDELRAKSGLMRGREFRMKDLYSFHVSQEDLDAYYPLVQEVYKRVYERLGLNALLTEASGGTFSKFSHEYQVEVPTGEDDIYICEKCGIAKNKEVYSGEAEECSHCGKTTWRAAKACEVGNIFKLGTKYSAPFNLTYTDKEGAQQPVIMGCYGIGTSRLMGVIVELFHDDHGIVWPENVAPFRVHVLALPAKDAAVREKVWTEAAHIVHELEKHGVDVLFDDRDETPGVKFNDADLIGIPYRVVVSEKAMAAGGVEVKARGEKESHIVSAEQFVKEIIG